MSVFELLQRLAYRCIGDKRYTYYDILKKNLSLSRNEMVELQNKLISNLINHAYNHTKYYKKIMDSLKLKPEDIKTKDDLKKLPLLTKSIIKDNIDDLKSDDHYGKNMRATTSGGSTGNQALVYHSPYFLHYSRAAGLRNFYITGWRPDEKSVWLWGAPYEHQKVNESFFSRIGILVNRRLLFNAFNYSTDDFDIWVKKILEFKPSVIFGYATIILQFSKYLLEKNILIPGIKRVVSTTEKLQDRELIEKAFGCDVFDSYGCREINGVGIEAKKGIMSIADDVVALNIYENGEFIITALHSFGFPLINYRLGDKGEKIDTNIENETNLPFQAIKLSIGRTTDNFITDKNRIISSSALSTYMSTFLINVVEHQVIQNDYRKFTINYVPDKNFDETHYIKSITTAINEYFGDNSQITFNKVDKIPVEKSGKKLMFKRTFLLDQ